MTDQAFVRIVHAYYRRHGRRDLPWRQTADPYRILVSEVMLQQTQVPRVIPKYEAFLRAFPNARALSQAPLGAVLKAWQGLGYNRRAKLLHDCARYVVENHRGRFPATLTELAALPGIGPYTAGAVMAFAYNEPVIVLETNIRTVYLHHFFKDKTGVADKELVPHLERTLDRKNPRAWYSALMDYGSHLKGTLGNQNHRSRHYAKQSKFLGSDRQIRGVILRLLAERARTEAAIAKRLSSFESSRIHDQLLALAREGLLEKEGHLYRLPE